MNDSHIIVQLVVRLVTCKFKPRIEKLGFIYIRAKANAKATSLLTCCIVSDLCIYTTATAVAANIKEKNLFRVRFRSNINEPLGECRGMWRCA